MTHFQQTVLDIVRDFAKRDDRCDADDVYRHLWDRRGWRGNLQTVKNAIGALSKAGLINISLIGYVRPADQSQIGNRQSAITQGVA